MAMSVNAGNTTGGPYKVGDYYNDGSKEGIVFVVFDGGYHGKIVSLDEGDELWAGEAVQYNFTGAASRGGGMGNMNKIKKQPNWKSNYPAFAWCASLGNSWYLPAVDELLLILDNKDAINRKLNEMGYGEILDGKYWSSTEKDNEYAWLADREHRECYFPKYNDGHAFHYVRAVATF